MITGSLQIKNGKYYAVINLYSNGKRKQKWIDTKLFTKGNKKKAQAFLCKCLQDYEHSQTIGAGYILFSDYLLEWIKTDKSNIDTVTYQSYLFLIDTYILPYFKAKEITLLNIDYSVLQEYFDYMAKDGKKNGGGIAPSMLRKHKTIINQALKQAVRNGLILSNPTSLVKLPIKSRVERDFYSIDETLNLLYLAKDDILYPFIFFASILGLRRSEICGLKWNAIDFRNNNLLIKSTVVQFETIVEKEKTKNQSSCRTFPLPDMAIDILKKIKSEQEQNRIFFGKEYFKSPYVFTWEKGKPISPSYVSHHFKEIIRKNNLRDIPFHGLRHSCASMLLSKGKNLKDVQEWLGHSNIKLTADLYGHLDFKRKKEITNEINTIISDNTEKC